MLFFGVPAMHTTATSTLARLGNAAVVPFFPRRLPDGTYELILLPALQDFPSDDATADTRRYGTSAALGSAVGRRCAGVCGAAH
jgi:KDO2-lipid IV(A) lauroyltransferase